jgi:hypothetical protein
MTVHGSTGSKLAGTVGASERQTLWGISDAKALILASQLHNLKAGKKPAVPWKIHWAAGRKLQGRNLHQKIKKQSICSVLRIARAASFVNLCSSQGQYKNLQDQNMQRASMPVDLTA